MALGILTVMACKMQCGRLAIRRHLDSGDAYMVCLVANVTLLLDLVTKNRLAGRENVLRFFNGQGLAYEAFVLGLGTWLLMMLASLSAVFAHSATSCSLVSTKISEV